MSRRPSHTILIARPPADVFAYMIDPSKLGTWQDVEEATQLTRGPIGPGTRFREVHKALGRRRTELTEVVVYEPGRRLDIRVVEGPPVDGRWNFSPDGNGTRLTFIPSVRTPPRLRPLQPVVAWGTALVFGRYHRRLKRALEAG
jgi:uncharacterized protein YndB with AHSA1/START domain